jgi:DNA-binding transcriptional regulator LsrR (DeoR family)
MAHMLDTDVHTTSAAGRDQARDGADPRDATAERLERLVRVSRLYYEVGATQDEIARGLGLTRAHVSKLLKEARAAGVVEIRIIGITEGPERVASALVERFGLKDAHLAPALAGSDILTRRRVGALAAQVLIAALRPGMTIGIGNGAAIAAMTDEVLDLDAPIPATVVPLAGGFWGVEAAREPYRRIADAIGAGARGLLAPGLLDDVGTRDALAAHAGIRAVTDLWSRLDLVAFGIGRPTWSEASVGPAAMTELCNGGAVGEILITPFDIQGNFLTTSLGGRRIAADVTLLRQVPSVIAVASGADKVEPILGALRTGLIRTLVTDAETAAAVLARDAATGRADGAGNRASRGNTTGPGGTGA